MACLSLGEVALFAAGGASTDLVTHVDGCESCRATIAAAVRAARSTSAPKHDDDFDIAPGTQIGRYEVIDLLGAGGMGRVYTARDPELARTVALKVLRATTDDAVLARLAREAQLTAQLSHPNVVSVYDTGRHGTHIYIAMELVAGQTLRAWLRTPRTWRQIADAFVQAGRGVASAHAAGVIHRDIKPDNIFVGRDGRVRIGDFGLARPTAETTTETVGTVPYMAPEQLDGKGTDERSDQFSFCVALYEALYGARPFTGASIAELRKAIDAGPPDKRGDVPRKIRAAVVRGLAVDPDARFASMSDLVATLGFDPRARRRLIAFGATAVVVLAVGVGSLVASSGDPCSEAPRDIASVWNVYLATGLGGAWRAAPVPNAAETWQRVGPALDRYAASWANGARDACRATRVDGHQSEAMLELRTVCLDRHRQELAAVVDAVREPTPAIVQRAVAIVDGLRPLTECNDLDALRAPVPPRRDASAGLLDAQLRQIEVATRAAQLVGLDREADAIVKRAIALDHPPLVAAAWTARGDVASALGDPKTAESAFYEAVWAAQAGRDQRAAVIAWTKLLVAVGVQQARRDEGVRLLHFADATLRGLGPDNHLRVQIEIASAQLYRDRGEFEAATAALARARSTPADSLLVQGKLEHVAGTIAYELGNYDEALARYQSAHDILVRALGPQHPDVARALVDLGNIYKDRDDFPRALDYYGQARELLRNIIPDAHPMVAAIEGNTALVYMEQKKYDDALAHQHIAVATFEKVYGPIHPDVAKELNNIGLTLTYANRAAEALPYFERAKDVFLKLGGTELDVAMCEHNLAIAYMDLKDDAKAEAHFRAAIDLRKRVAPMHPELARSMSRLAALMTRTNRFEPAAELLVGAIAIIEHAHGPTNPELAKPLLDLGWIRNRQSKFADAIEPLERVVAIHATTKNPLLGVSRFELANALWGANRDRARAIELAKLAKQGLDPKSDDAKEIDAWVAKHKL